VATLNHAYQIRRVAEIAAPPWAKCCGPSASARKHINSCKVALVEHPGQRDVLTAAIEK